ncbi:hypothetical protein BKA65DRAFT_600578 [Rhexocercosporidium sp. MPI-PUGE-AT-0058]|nr:hypothetical protein BKA65DRAFT_600578 [Rhexocercosporidium sp. MPI-PUGE-AT-0058]
MCPAESANILLFLEPPRPYRSTSFREPAGAKIARPEKKHSLESGFPRVRPIRPNSPTAVYFRYMKRRYPELVTIRPTLLQDYPAHIIHFGRKPLMIEEGSAGIKKPFSFDDPQFAYKHGALFTVNIYLEGKKHRVTYFPPIRQPKPQKHHLTRALVYKLENMASNVDFELAARSHSDGSLPLRILGPDEKRTSLHKLMLAQHENAIDSSEDEDDDDEGGIPAWISMRRSLYPKRMVPTDQEATGPSSACVTAGPSRRNSASIRADYNNNDNAQDTVEGGSESSRDRDVPTPAETETELQLSSYQEDESPSPPKYTVGASTWDALKSDEPGSYDYVEYYSGSCKVMRGGFVHAKENIRPKVLSEPFRTFPPLSNRGYMLTSTGHDPKFVHRAEPAHSTFIPRSYIKAILLNSKPAAMPKPPAVPLPAKGPNAEDQWVDSDGAISEASSTGGIRQYYSTCTVFALCRKCGKHHIPPGSFLSLWKRDTCGSYLPDWFPAEDFEYPWQAYTDLINEIHRLESLERGYTSLPKMWDKVHHDEHPVWKALGHRGGGWWRCRTGPNAPQAERKCHQCHVVHPPEILHPNIETMDSAMRSLGKLRNLVRSYMNRVGQKDKAISLEMIRATMQSHTSLLPSDLRTLGIGWDGHNKKENEEEREEQPPMTEERMVLEAMWNHHGPISTLDIPFQPTFGFAIAGDADEENPEDDEENDEDENGLAMKTTTRRRPRPLFLHRQTSSLGSNFFASLLSPKSPLPPASPGIPEEENEVSQSAK